MSFNPTLDAAFRETIEKHLANEIKNDDTPDIDKIIRYLEKNGYVVKTREEVKKDERFNEKYYFDPPFVEPVDRYGIPLEPSSYYAREKTIQYSTIDAHTEIPEYAKESLGHSGMMEEVYHRLAREVGNKIIRSGNVNIVMEQSHIDYVYRFHLTMPVFTKNPQHHEGKWQMEKLFY
jgi:hypothetical protein